MMGAVLVIVLLHCAVQGDAAYEDARCKCVCVDHSVPKVSNESSTEPKRSVYVKSIPSEKCTCPIMLEDKSSLCPYCDCKYQVRNTATIKVVVIMIVAILSTLSLYLVFMLILEPFLATRGRKALLGFQQNTLSSSKTIRTFRSYLLPPQRTKFIAFILDAVRAGSEASGSRGLSGGSNAVVNRAREQQSRWMDRTEAQRDRVFNERTILN